ncbi:MAG: inositol monophosphatase [Phycisphaerae bacterium]
MNHDLILEHLLAMQADVRDAVITGRTPDMAAVARSASADTIYAIDAVVEPIVERHCEELARHVPLMLISEGLVDEHGQERPVVYPHGTPEEDAQIRLIIDPIDGTRGFMYDKRSAWALAAVAPNRGRDTRLRDCEIAVMTELPTSKMNLTDVAYAVKGRGVKAFRVNLTDSTRADLPLAPSRSPGIEHGFMSVSNFFPGTKEIASRLMEKIAHALLGPADVTRATVFDDQYICTGGQFWELISGKDRFCCDLRPAFYKIQNQPAGLCCHPYDCAALLIAEEAGAIITDEAGRPLDMPLDTETDVNWVGYANPTLRQKIEPLLQAFLQAGGR